MSFRIRRDEWIPQGVEGLEEAALQAVKAIKSAMVVAGPGAGKTELLAQRACFLLQTGACPWPRRILAISFKRDAARNLADRVELRCGTKLASRFHSFTFDAFAKRLVDRFGQAVPQQFRPARDYAIRFDLSPASAGKWIREQLPTNSSSLSIAHRQSINGERMYWHYFVGRALADGFGETSMNEVAAAELWRHMLHGGGGSVMNFHMVGRLAQLVLTSNPKILRSLRAAYSHVFLDEFQDTNGIHYDLISTAFRESNAILTAVGDNKQRVNKWAGALDGIFDRYGNDFQAERVHLVMNYRSARELVRVQAFIAAAIDNTAPPAVPAKATGPEGECRSLVFASYEREASYLAETIQEWIQKEKLEPRDICVLCRQRPADYAKLLQQELKDRGINARVENELQDLLAEPLTTGVLNLLRLCCPTRASQSWADTVDLLADLRGITAEAAEKKEVARLRVFLKTLSSKVKQLQPDKEGVEATVDSVVEFFGEKELKAYYPQYAQGEYYTELRKGLAEELAVRLTGSPLEEALDDLEGKSSLPVMTMHKSKGLEYHTVIFVGLEDAALWGFDRAPDEETCGFFVALSRAKQRAIFTFSRSRRRRGDSVEPQSRRNIKALYNLLASAGVHPEEVE